MFLNQPDVGFRGENTVQEALGWHPLDGKHGLSALTVVVAAIDVPCHAEVGDLDDPIRTLAGEKAITGRNVAVYETSVLHVFATVRHVVGAHYEVFHGQRRRPIL